MEPDAKLAELLKQREALKQKMKQELKDAQKHVEDAQRKRKADTGKTDPDFPNPRLSP